MYYALQNGHENFNFQKTLNLEVVDDPVARQQFLDFLIYLPNDILVKVDRATMANSLESRMPFLSPRLVDFSWSLPLHQKIRNGTGKWLLREVLYRHVPKNLIDRPKAGFAIPVSLWLKGPLKTWADNLIKTSELKWVHEKWASHLIGNRDHSAVLWNF